MKALEIVLKDDRCGFGDQIGCCPICAHPFNFPLDILLSSKNTGKQIEYPCGKCGQLLIVKRA